MPTSARQRKHIDAGRLGQLVKGPGQDPRSWVSMGRIDDDPDAIRWDEDQGWIVDVTFAGGTLDQEGPVPCRVSRTFAGDGQTKTEPVSRGCEVIVALAGGDGAGAVIFGQMHNGDGCNSPTTVGALPINEETALSHHIFKTDKAVAMEIQGDVTLTAPLSALSLTTLSTSVTSLSTIDLTALAAVSIAGASIALTPTTGPPLLIPGGGAPISAGTPGVAEAVAIASKVLAELTALQSSVAAMAASFTGHSHTVPIVGPVGVTATTPPLSPQTPPSAPNPVGSSSLNADP